MTDDFTKAGRLGYGIGVPLIGLSWVLGEIAISSGAAQVAIGICIGGVLIGVCAIALGTLIMLIGE